DLCRRRAALPQQQPPSGLLAEVPGPEGLETLWETEYQQQLVGRALRLMQTEFQPATWKACWETVVNDRPIAEVAEELGLSVASVYAARSRVLRRLREELAGLLDE